MGLQSKALWIENLKTSGDKDLALKQIATTKANMVCVRTNSTLLKDLIDPFHKMNLTVYGWRWPYVVPGHKDHAYAPEEAKHVAEVLIPAGLDGYIMDIESDENGSDHDWDRSDVGDLKKLATEYCKVIKDAAMKSGHAFKIGLTSHAKGFANYPKIPWGPFLAITDVIYPQTYWRYFKDEDKKCHNENKGTPEKALEIGYKDAGPKKKPILPIAGELRCVTVQEIAEFGSLIAARGVTEGHFYVSQPEVTDPVLNAVAAL
jgi:hypothetical protein